MANQRAYAGGLDGSLATIDRRLKNLEFPPPDAVIDRYPVTPVAASQYLNAWQPLRHQQFTGSMSVNYPTSVSAWGSVGTPGVSRADAINGGSVGAAAGPGSHTHGFSGSGRRSFVTGVSRPSLSVGAGLGGWTSRGLSYNITAHQWRALVNSDGWRPWYIVQAHGSRTDLLRLEFEFAGSSHFQMGIGVTREHGTSPPEWRSDVAGLGPNFYFKAGAANKLHRFEMEWRHMDMNDGLHASQQIDSRRWFVVWARSMNNEVLGENGRGGGSRTRDKAQIRPPDVAFSTYKTADNGKLLDLKHNPAAGIHRQDDWGARVYSLNREPGPG
ncbi:hypothetical protein [Streptomyces yunnanensis]|uniref:hypothetical protein n=1 Tax=Streptomyces yunnanensis TaxID=156453 RepID=UPI000937A503|nr:hypothetical protein [Streptomyces yunnanensis]